MERKKSYYKKEHVYSLEEKPENEISPLWQIVQVIFYLCSISCGFAVSYCFSNVMVTMNQNCILYSKIVFNDDSHYKSNITNDIKSIEPIFDHHSDAHCNIVIFIPVIITSFGSFFMVLFVICGRGGTGNKSLPDTWRIIMPSIIFNFISFGLSLFSANSFETGMGLFLQSFSKASKHEKFEIKDLSNLYLDGVYVGTRLVSFLVVTKYAIRMLVSFWGLNFFWILLRCVFIVDFQLVRTTIHVYPREAKVIKMPALKNTVINDNLSNTSIEAREGNNAVVQRDSAIRFRTVQFSPSTKDIPQHSEPIFSDASTSTSAFDETGNLADPFRQELPKKVSGTKAGFRRKKQISQ